jgi:hypothetical protein
LRGSLYTTILSSLDSDIISKNLLEDSNIFDKSDNKELIDGEIDFTLADDQEYHVERSAYVDWYNSAGHHETGDEETMANTQRPNHNLLHTNYDDLMFEEFK